MGIIDASGKVALYRLFTSRPSGVAMINEKTGKREVCVGIIYGGMGDNIRFYVTGYVPELSSDVDVMLQTYRDTGYKDTSGYTTLSLRALIDLECMIVRGKENIIRQKPPIGWKWGDNGHIEKTGN
jgi:hypothetical protein